MAHHSLGSVTVPVSGNPVQATINQATPSQRIACYSVMFEALPGNTGKVYIGLTGMNFHTWQQCVGWIAIPTSHSSPAFIVTLTYAPGAINIMDYYIDVDVSGEGVLIAYLSG